MPRTTLKLDPTVLRELKRRGKAEGKSLGDLASELIARALNGPDEGQAPRPLRLHTKAMHARMDLEDRDVVQQALDRP